MAITEEDKAVLNGYCLSKDEAESYLRLQSAGRKNTSSIRKNSTSLTIPRWKNIFWSLLQIQSMSASRKM